ncbi:MAG TPA: cell cycle transcriptional regulator TrcR [Alphaproteobacteria bacterium]|nr:cell cycle transcriptional regulator TrcR [Alphaproteobacteria bacterium]
MTLPLMPKATAVWLVENTSLTFDQIAEFCGMHPLEVQGIADGEVAIGIVGLDPVANGQLTREEIARCEGDKTARLKMVENALPLPVVHGKGAKYTPVSKRQDRPNAIAWLVRHHPELTDAQVSRLVGTTKATIEKVRDRTHWDMANIKPQNPVSLGLCSQQDLDDAIEKAHRAAMRAKQNEERAKRRVEREKAAKATAPKPEEAPAEGEAPSGEKQTAE